MPNRILNLLSPSSGGIDLGIAGGATANAVRHGADLAVFASEIKQRVTLPHDYIFDLGNENGVVSCILCSVQAALEVGQRTVQDRSSVWSAIEARSRFFLGMLVDPGRARIVFRNRALICSQNIHSKSFLGVQMRVR